MKTIRMKLSKKNRGALLMIIGLVLVLAAASLTGYNIWDETRAENAMSQVLSELDILAETEKTDDRILNIPGISDIPEYVLNPFKDMPAQIIDGNSYIGVLEVPSLGLRLPVMEEWSYPNLKISPCHYSGSAYLKNMVVAGHNYRSHFGSLNRLSVGDEIIFVDMDENRFIYTVSETEIVMPTDIAQMITGDWDLTLFTCTLGGRTRFTVRCTEITGSTAKD